MDFIKVLNKHVIFDYTDLNDSEFRAWITIMSLTAFMESMPTREQILKHVHYKTLESLQRKLNTRSIDLQYVLNKVLMDAQEVVNKREYWKKKQKEKREHNKNVNGDIKETSPLREDIEKIEIREDNIGVSNDTPSSPDDPGTDPIEESPTTEKCPHKEIIALYHEILTHAPKVKLWTDDMRKILRTRWKEDRARQSLEWWRKYFNYVKESDFLCGKANSFVADLEWLVRPTNFGKVINGRYHTKGTGGNQKHAGIVEWLQQKQGEA